MSKVKEWKEIYYITTNQKKDDKAILISKWILKQIILLGIEKIDLDVDVKTRRSDCVKVRNIMLQGTFIFNLVLISFVFTKLLRYCI